MAVAAVAVGGGGRRGEMCKEGVGGGQLSRW